MGHHHYTRREVLSSIWALGTGSLLLPRNVLWGETPSAKTPVVIRGAIRDGISGKGVAAKLRVTDVRTGQDFLPADAIRSMPPPDTRSPRRYFYARGSYEIAVPPGDYQIEVVRGIEHDTVTTSVAVDSDTTRVRDFSIPALRDLKGAGWYSGNTHTHYRVELDEDPDERLRLVPPAEALDVSVLSYLIRNDLPYISNKYRIGRLPEFSRDGTLVDMGEEARNNTPANQFGYGHCLFLDIPRLVEPVSTGMLSRDGKAPDFPTLSMLCEEAKRIGGTTVWCHNGGGMETPVAIALGLVDAYNLADGSEADYTSYYRYLNCGFRLPLSSGTDWWIYDHNRVFVQVEGAFSYDSWLAGLRAGRTFVSNGPLLDLTVDGRRPGSSIETAGPLKVAASAVSRLPFDRLEIILDGNVVAERTAVAHSEAWLEIEIPVKRSGWVAARITSDSKTHAGYTVFAHTSPVYHTVHGTLARRAEPAARFVEEIERSIGYIRKTYRFASEADLALALGRFRQGKEFYARLTARA